MPLKDLEHAGNEEFETFSNRVIAKKEKEQKQLLDNKEVIDSKAKAQEKWLSVSNPHIWN